MSRRECDDQACDYESILRSNEHQKDIENDIPLHRIGSAQGNDDS